MHQALSGIKLGLRELLVQGWVVYYTLCDSICGGLKAGSVGFSKLHTTWSKGLRYIRLVLKFLMETILASLRSPTIVHAQLDALVARAQCRSWLWRGKEAGYKSLDKDVVESL